MKAETHCPLRPPPGLLPRPLAAHLFYPAFIGPTPLCTVTKRNHAVLVFFVMGLFHLAPQEFIFTYLLPFYLRLNNTICISHIHLPLHSLPFHLSKRHSWLPPVGCCEYAALMYLYMYLFRVCFPFFGVYTQELLDRPK